jgi:hypothetical protein
MCDRNEQYSPTGIRLSRGYSRFTCCGVSVGEMARVLGDVNMVDEQACFERNPSQFRLASEYLSLHQERLARRVPAFPCVVYNHEAIEPFNYSYTSFDARILPAGEAQIQVVSIDHVLLGFHSIFVNL